MAERAAQPLFSRRGSLLAKFIDSYNSFFPRAKMSLWPHLE